jgi:hypothetical protein
MRYTVYIILAIAMIFIIWTVSSVLYEPTPQGETGTQTFPFYLFWD